MIKKLSLLMLLMALFAPWAANAQETVEIGDGTSQKPNLPVNMTSNYSLTQQIYTADEIGMAGTITSIALDYAYTDSFTMDGFQVYMMHVDKSVFASNSDIEELSDATKVYEGTFSANGAGWGTLQLSTPFPYDGESNLLICCFDPDSDKPGSSYKFHTTSTGDNYTSLVYYSNSVIPNVNNISSYSGTKVWYKYHNNIQLVIVPTICPGPTRLTCTGTTANTATLSWIENGEATEWQICLNGNENNPITVTENPYTLTNLTPGTAYTAKVRANCGDEDGLSGWSNSVSFTPSESQIVTIGSGETTNSYLPAYTFYNNNLSEQIYTAEEVGMAGTITSISFFNGGSEKSPEIKIYMVNTDQTEFSSTTDWLSVTESDLVFGNASVTFTVGEWTTIELDTPFEYDGTSNLGVIVDEHMQYSSGLACRVFTSTSNCAMYVYSDGTDYNAVGATYTANNRLGVKNQIKLEIASAGPTTCPRPTRLTCTGTTANTATLSWIENGEATEWQICLNGDENNPITVTESPYTLTNLTPEMAYTAKVRANCGNEDGLSRWSNTISFTPSAKVIITGTQTGTNNYLPFNNFYNYSLTQQIYTIEELGAPGFIRSIDFFKPNATEANRNLSIYMVNTDKDSFTGTSDWISVTSENLVFSGSVNFANNDWTTITLDNDGFLYDGTQNIAIIVDDNTGSYESTTAFNTFTTSSNQSIYYYNDNTNYDPLGTPGTASGTTNSKNQIRLEITPAGPTTCPRPTRLTCTGTTANTATLSWIENGEAVEWQICLNGNENNPITVTENPYTLTNLTPEMAYTAKVRANCGNEDGLSGWSNTVSFTPSAKVIIGSGTATSSYVPTYTLYNYSYTQQIYTIDELGAPGFITSIDFFMTSSEYTRNLDIYMVSTDKDSFNGSSDWISVTNDDLVFSGNVDFVADDWTTITLNGYGFLYDGTQNVAIIVDDNTGSWSSSRYFRSFTASANQAIYVYSDGTNYDPMNPTSSGTTMTSKNQIRILKSNLSCMPPFNLNVTDITSSSAVLNWTGDAESYNVSYYKAYFFESFEEDLSQWTIYKEGDDDSWEWGIENPHDNSSDLNAHSGDYAVVAYSAEEVHADSWLVSPQILIPSQATLKFWIMRSTYDDAQDEYEVRLSTTGNAISNFTTVLKEKEVANSTWTEVAINLSDYAGQECYIAIRHDFTGGFFIMVDDFGIYGWSEEITTTDSSLLIEDLLPETEYLWHVQANCSEEDGQSPWVSNTFTTLPPCPVPFDLTVSEETANGATIAWTGYSDSYMIMVSEGVQGTYSYDFEDGTSQGWTLLKGNEGTSPNNWMHVSEYPTSANDMSSGHGHNDSDGFMLSESYISGESQGAGTPVYPDNYLVSPLVPLGGSITFYAGTQQAQYCAEQFSLMVSTTGNSAIGNFTTVQTWIFTTTETSGRVWNEYTVDLSAFSGMGYVAFHHFDCYDEWLLCIDDITISSSTSSSVSMTYQAEASPFILNDATNIHPETTYLVKVKGICDDEETEYSEGITFTTLDENTKIFVTEGDWSDGNNWVPAGVPSIDDDAILRAEATVFDVAEANNITIEGMATLIIEDGGQLKTNADVVGTMKKFIIGYGTDYVETNDGYYLMALPTAAPISADSAGLITEESEYDLYGWNGTATDEEWQNNHNGIDLQSGIGFLYSNRGDMEMSFTATLRNSSEPVVVTPSYNNMEHGGWNLYGNPFPCEVYITTDAEDMTFYRLIGNELVPFTGTIAPLEGFFVKATAAGQTFTISREAPEESKARTNNNTEHFRLMFK